MLALHAGPSLEVHVIRPLALLSLLCLVPPAGADEMTPLKPPLTKEQERDRFHPHREGMPPEPRLAGYERRLQMEKDSPLSGLRFRAVGPEVQGGRIVDIEATGHLYTNNAERGVYKSTDGGESWTRVLYVDDRTGAIDLVQDPSRPEVLYAAMWERARTARNFLESGPGSGIWKTTDAGAHWTRLGGGLPTGATVGRIGLALPAVRPQTVYAVIDNQSLRPESDPLDEETPPGELTARRLRPLSADAFARLDDAVVTRFLRRYDFPKSLKAAVLKREVKAGKITIADLIAYLSDANRDLFDRQIEGSEIYRTDDGGATWARTA